MKRSTTAWDNKVSPLETSLKRINEEILELEADITKHVNILEKVLANITVDFLSPKIVDPVHQEWMTELQKFSLTLVLVKENPRNFDNNINTLTELLPKIEQANKESEQLYISEFDVFTEEYTCNALINSKLEFLYLLAKGAKDASLVCKSNLDIIKLHNQHIEILKSSDESTTNNKRFK